MKTSEVLLRAAKMIHDRERWCWEAEAVNDKGMKVDPCDFQAVRWCAIGSVKRIAKNGWWFPIAAAVSLLHFAASEVDPRFCTIDAINDRLGHRAVMKAYGIAIRKALAAERGTLSKLASALASAPCSPSWRSSTGSPMH